MLMTGGQPRPWVASKGPSVFKYVANGLFEIDLEVRERISEDPLAASLGFAAYAERNWNGRSGVMRYFSVRIRNGNDTWYPTEAGIGVLFPGIS